MLVSFNLFKMLLYYRFTCIVSSEKPDFTLTFVPLNLMTYFFHCQFKIFCLPLVLSNLIMMCFDVSFMFHVLIVH